MGKFFLKNILELMQGPQYSLATILLKALFCSVYSVIIYIENLTEGKVTN